MDTVTSSSASALGAKVIHAVLSVIVANGGSMRKRDAIDEIDRTIELDEWAREELPKTRNVRCRSISATRSTATR